MIYRHSLPDCALNRERISAVTGIMTPHILFVNFSSIMVFTSTPFEDPATGVFLSPVPLNSTRYERNAPSEFPCYPDWCKIPIIPAQ
jgi:hypothetical protein